MSAAASPSESSETFNFQTANVLLIEQGNHGLDILIQVFSGFGTRNCYKSMSVVEAMEITRRNTLDLVVIDPMLKGEDGHEYIRWLRRSGIDPNRSAPVVVASSNGTRSAVRRARDAGANCFLVKPVRPGLLFERVVRIARERRAFIVGDTYTGPDRRFRNEGPPPGTTPRRSTDLTSQLGDATTPNMSQDEINTMIKPQKVSL